MMLGDVRNGIGERQLEEALSKLETIVDQAATSEKVDKTALRTAKRSDRQSTS